MPRTSIPRIARPLLLLFLFAAPAAVARAQSAAGVAQNGQNDQSSASSNSATLPDAPSPSSTNGNHVRSDVYVPITPGQRLWWALTSTLGPHHVLGNAFLAAY